MHNYAFSQYIPYNCSYYYHMNFFNYIFRLYFFNEALSFANSSRVNFDIINIISFKKEFVQIQVEQTLY